MTSPSRPARRLFGSVALLGLLPVGCALVPVASRSVPNVHPTEVTRRAARSFSLHEIPVRDLVPDYRVDSGDFEVGPVWAAAGIEARVDCGVDREGRDRARGRTVLLRVTVTVRHQRQTVPGTGSARTGTLVYLESYGRTVDDEREPARCSLRGTFTDALLTDIAGTVPEGLPGPGGPVGTRPPGGF